MSDFQTSVKTLVMVLCVSLCGASQPVGAGPDHGDEAETHDDAAAKVKPSLQRTWSRDEVASARSRCQKILRQIHAVAIPIEPIKRGACGTPAPYELVSVGRNPQVAISPPATITCDLAEGIAKWLEQDLQPLAKKHLGAPIITIQNMSSYSCRTAYGRKGAGLSQHAYANALDIRGFVAASAKSANVLAHWGKTQRDIRAEIAARKKAARDKQRAADAKRAKDQAEKRAAQALKPTQGPSLRFSIPRFSNAGESSEATFSLGPAVDPDSAASNIGEPSRLGGPKLSGRKPLAQPAASTFVIEVKPGANALANAAKLPREAFLKHAHASACRIFGTTLGPEANRAHRNHFHIDMAERKRGPYCR